MSLLPHVLLLGSHSLQLPRIPVRAHLSIPSCLFSSFSLLPCSPHCILFSVFLFFCLILSLRPSPSVSCFRQFCFTLFASLSYSSFTYDQELTPLFRCTCCGLSWCSTISPRRFRSFTLFASLSYSSFTYDQELTPLFRCTCCGLSWCSTISPRRFRSSGCHRFLFHLVQVPLTVKSVLKL